MLDEPTTLAMLRGAGTVSPATTDAHAQAARQAGTRIRRRRRAARAAGSGAALSMVLALSVGLSRNDGIDVVQGSAKQANDTLAKNQALLLQVFGPHFRVSEDDAGRAAVEVVPGSPSAAELPTGYQATAYLSVRLPGDGKATTIAQRCQPQAAEGLDIGGCRPVRAFHGTRTVQVQEFRTVPGAWEQTPSRVEPSAWDGTKVYYERHDGAIVETSLTVRDDIERATAERQRVAVDWLAGYTGVLAELAADDRVAPWQGTVVEATAPSDAGGACCATLVMLM